MECSAVGVLDASGDGAGALPALLERLARVSGEAPELVRQLEVVLGGPAYTPGQKGPELRLINQLQPTEAQKQQQQGAAKPQTAAEQQKRQEERWVVRHEGLPFRGKGVAELPATIRSVTESVCESADVLGFWRALGFAHAYSMVKEGSCFRCWLDGQRLRVCVVRVLKGGGSAAGGDEVAPGCWLVEAVAAPAEGQHAEAAAAIGALAKLLDPLVALQK